MKCKAVTKSGNPCNNEALEGSEYCMVPAHQAMSKKRRTLRSIGNFRDGNLAERFGDEGYPAIWPNGERRVISEDLYLACIASGARLEETQ